MVTWTNSFFAISSSSDLFLELLLPCPFSGADERAFGEFLDQPFFVFRRATQVRAWLGLACGKLCSLSDARAIQLLAAQKILRIFRLDRCGAHIGQSNA